MDGAKVSRGFGEGESPISSHGLNGTSDQDEIFEERLGGGDGDGASGLFGSEDEGSGYVRQLLPFCHNLRFMFL